MNIDEQVKQFHEKFGIPVKSRPAVPPEDRVRLRLKLIAEEFFELLNSACPSGFFDEEAEVMSSLEVRDIKVDLVEFADALGDIDYVVAGTRLEFGIEARSIANEIHAANMRKEGGPSRSDGKILKPQGWVPPNIERVLDDQGRAR